MRLSFNKIRDSGCRRKAPSFPKMTATHAFVAFSPVLHPC
jgi:hypothetical protein